MFCVVKFAHILMCSNFTNTECNMLHEHFFLDALVNNEPGWGTMVLTGIVLLILIFAPKFLVGGEDA